MLKTSKLALGTVQFGLNYGISNKEGATDLKEVNKILQTAKILGINTIDTAAAYGNSEMILGQNDLSKFRVTTKFIDTSSHENFVNQINSSFQKLRLEKIYAIMAHRPLVFIENHDYWKFLSDLKEQGKINKIGASFNSVQELDRLLDKGIYLDIIQVPFNILDQRFENYMKKLKGMGIEIHTRSTFLQGLFFCDINSLDDFFNPLKEYLCYLQSWKEELPQVLLSYVMNKSFIDKVVIGVNNSKQLLENVQNLDDNSKKIIPYNNELDEALITPSMWPKIK
jgi:aryl-alcohol dehydrogenase-like predicted oxidoreductase